MFTTSIKIINHLRLVGFIEGLSYIVLLFISMPLKYLANLPQAVKVNGWLHGVLFVWFLVALLAAWIHQKWSFKKVFIAGLASFIPFGTFWFDKQLRKDIELLEAKN